MAGQPIHLSLPPVRFSVGLVLGSALFLGCGGAPTGVPGQGAANLPPQTNPGVTDKDKDKAGAPGEVPKRNLKGSVIDALTGEPVDKALVIIEGFQTTSVSTPIPPAPSPGPEEMDAAPPVGGGGGPGKRTFQLAQAENPIIDEAPLNAPSTALPAPGNLDEAAIASPAAVVPGVSTVPATAATGTSAASPAIPAAPAPAASVPAAGTSPTPVAGNPGASAPVPMGTPYPVTTYRVDSQGKFELKDLPEGSYNLTFWAPGYQAVSLIGALPGEVDIPLRPLDPDLKKLHEVKGVVRLANNQPAGDVDVEISSLTGRLAGQRESTDEQGNFKMQGIPSGNYSLAAWTTDADGEIASFAMVKEVPVSLGRERRSVSPTLVLRAVTNPLLFAGTVEGSAKEAEIKAALAEKKPVPGMRPLRVLAAIQVGDGEIPIASVPVAKDGYFRLRLPPLPDGATYHLTATGQSETGQLSYRHLYDLESADPKLSLKLPDAPTAVTVIEGGKHPRFSWDALNSQITAYRLSVDKAGPDGDTLWEAWTSGTGANLPNIKELAFLREGESYRYSLSAVKLLDDKKFELSQIVDRPWEASGITKPATFEVVRAKGSELKLQSTRSPAPTKKPSSAPAPVKPLKSAPPVSGKGAPSLAPASPGTRPDSTATPMATPRVVSPKPSPQNPRIKPMEDIEL
jgi:hypothetical protein